MKRLLFFLALLALSALATDIRKSAAACAEKSTETSVKAMGAAVTGLEVMITR